MGSLSVKDIANRALQELGLPTALTIMSEDGDPAGFQLMGLQNALGLQLTKIYDWQFLEKTVEFTGDGVTTEFDMPADYGRMVNQTQWSSKNKRPMYGPMSPQGWSWVQYGIVSVGVYYRYRIINDKFHVFPTPAAGEKFHFYYISKNWLVNNSSGTPVFRDKIESDDDFPLFDDERMVTGAKLKLWSAKVMDIRVLSDEFYYILEACKSETQGAPVIALDSRWEHLYISGQNVPDGTWNV